MYYRCSGSSDQRLKNSTIIGDLRVKFNPAYYRKELKSLFKDVQTKGYAIIPMRLYINDKGYAKLEIALAKGKKLYDKRSTIKDRDNKRELDRAKKADY